MLELIAQFALPFLQPVQDAVLIRVLLEQAVVDITARGIQAHLADLDRVDHDAAAQHGANFCFVERAGAVRDDEDLRSGKLWQTVDILHGLCNRTRHRRAVAQCM